MAAWDWLMSLSPDWYSTMFGLYYLAGGFVTALAAISLLAVLAKRAGYLPEINGSHFYALGRLMFAFLVFWAYTAYWQYTAVLDRQPADRGGVVLEAQRRGATPRSGCSSSSAHFGLPFFVLLSYWIKRRAWGITAVAIWMLPSHYFDVHWIVAAARGRRTPFSWMDGAAILCCRRVRRVALRACGASAAACWRPCTTRPSRARWSTRADERRARTTGARAAPRHPEVRKSPDELPRGLILRVMLATVMITVSLCFATYLYCGCGCCSSVPRARFPEQTLPAPHEVAQVRQELFQIPHPRPTSIERAARGPQSASAGSTASARDRARPRRDGDRAGGAPRGHRRRAAMKSATSVYAAGRRRSC